MAFMILQIQVRVLMRIPQILIIKDFSINFFCITVELNSS